jgi:hypothetical protein
MNCMRSLALAAAPTALLIGMAAGPAVAASSPAPKAASCKAPGPNQVLTSQQATKLFKGCVTARAKAKAIKTWHWMGNYGGVYEVAAAANNLGVGAGELITVPNASGGGLLPTFMFY